MTITMRPATVIVAVPAEIDIANDAAVLAALTVPLAAGAVLVIADMTATRFCSVSGVRAFIAAARAARAEGAVIRLMGMQPAVRRIFALMEIGTVPGLCYPDGRTGFTGLLRREEAAVTGDPEAVPPAETETRMHQDVTGKAVRHGLGYIGAGVLRNVPEDDLAWQDPAGGGGRGAVEVARRGGFVLIRDPDSPGVSHAPTL